MKFANTDIELELRATPTKFSRVLSSNFHKFTETKKSGGEVTTSDGEAAEFLTKQVYYLLESFYKYKPLPAWEEFEESVTLEEITEFLNKQVDVNGPHDFLLQPYKALLQALDRISLSIVDTVDKETTKILNP